MVFKRNAIQVGDTVRITVEIETIGGTFTSGHRFRVIGTSDRGYDLEDEFGNRALEVPREFFEREDSD